MKHINKTLILFTFLMFSSSCFGLTPIKQIEAAVTESERSEVMNFTLLYSKESNAALYGLVKYEVYSNGSCRDRGACGCGIEFYYASVVINGPSQPPKVQSLHLGGCKSHYGGETLYSGSITSIVIDDLTQSCYATTKYSGLKFYAYDEKSPELGLRLMTGDEFVRITGKDPDREATEEITVDDCFYEKYFKYTDSEWRGASGREMIFKKIKDKQGIDQVGDFIGYWDYGSTITPTNNPAIRPQEVAQYIRPISKPEVISPNKQLEMALSHYKKQQYVEAEEMYYMLVRNNSKFIYPGNVSVLNDLALTQYKLKKYDESISWSLEVLKRKNIKNYARLAASANYHLGLAYEAKVDLERARSYYQDSYGLRKSSAVKQALDRVSKQ